MGERPSIERPSVLARGHTPSREPDHTSMSSFEELQHLLAQVFQAHPWHGVSPSETEGFVNAYVEIVPTEPVKYELDKPTGLLRLDRPQRFSSLPPNLYGFI